MNQVMAAEGGNLFTNLESPVSSPPGSNPPTPTGCRSPTGYQTSAPNSPEGSPVLRRKKRAKKVLSACEEEKEEEMTGDKVAEVSVKGGKGRVLWRPSKSFDTGSSERAVPPWAEADAQAPPPPSNFYTSSPNFSASPTYMPMRPAGGMATGVQANPNPTHFNRPSGASPVPFRKCLFRAEPPTRSLSNESLNKSLPWAIKKKEAPGGDIKETDTLCPMIMTGDSRSRMDQMRGRGSTRSVSLPRVGHGRAESPLSSKLVGGGGGNLPAGRGKQEAHPHPTQTLPGEGRGASESQNMPRPQVHSQGGVKNSPHTAADPPDRTDLRHHPPGKMVSAKTSAEAKATTSAEQSSPTPWRKIRPTAPTESTPPPDQSSPTPWRKNTRNQDTSAKAAPSTQKQQTSKDNVSISSVFESNISNTSSSSSIKSQHAPWRKAATQKSISTESSSSQSISTTTETKSTSFKQKQVIQTSELSVGVTSEEVSKTSASVDASISKQQPTHPQPNWRRQQPKNQSPTPPAPCAAFTGANPVFAASQPCVPEPVPVSQTPPAEKLDPALHLANNAVCPVSVTGKNVASVPVVIPSPSQTPSPIVAPNKSAALAPAAGKSPSSAPTTDNLTPAAFPTRPTSPALVSNKTVSPVTTINKTASPGPAENKPTSLVSAANKSISANSGVNKCASSALAENNFASLAPAATKIVTAAPVSDKSASPIPAEDKPSSPSLAVRKSVSPTATSTKPLSPVPTVSEPILDKHSSVSDTFPSGVDKAISPTPATGIFSATLVTTVSCESLTSITDSKKTDGSALEDQSSISVISKTAYSELAGKGDSINDEKKRMEKGVTSSLPEPDHAPNQPLAPTALYDTRSPTPPLPPKQTAASIVSAPAVPLAPKPSLAPVDQTVIPPPTFHPIPPPQTEPLPPPPPTQSKFPTQSTPQSDSPPPVPPPPPLPRNSPIQISKIIPPMTSAVSTAPAVSLPMPVPSPTPGLIPIPPPEPTQKTAKSSSSSPSVGSQKSPASNVSDEEINKGSVKSTESSTSIPHPEFPPPPPLNVSGPTGTLTDIDQNLPPPPSFLQEQKSVSPPMSLSMVQGDRPSVEGEEFPSPEYVRESVTKRIKAFEKQASKDEEPPVADRQSPAARPVAPWVKKTSSGPVNQENYWGMTSPEEDPSVVGTAASIATTTKSANERDVEHARSQPKTQVPSINAKGDHNSPAPSSPSSKGKEPGLESPINRRLRLTSERQRTSSIGELEAQYLVPSEDKIRKMPAEGGDVPTATTPEEVKPAVKSDDSLFDPWCDPKNPRIINFQDVSAAAFKIKSGIMNTPCTLSHMSSFTDMEIYFKKEFNQYTGSFKERGARYTLLMLSEEQRKKGVIAASAGNHALALSYHGQDLGIPVTVVMPLVAPIMKVQACRQYGANIIVKGKDIGECREIALRMSKEQGILYINGYDHPHILAGQGTMGLEIVEQVKDIDAVVIPVGGGGLIAGVALAVKALYPHVKVIGVESERCASFSGAMKAGRPVYVAAETTLADGLAVPTVGVNAFATASKLVDKIVQVREEWIAIAILRLVECEKAVVEGAGATALAAILAGELPELKGKRIVIPLCGGNIDTTVLGRCLERGLAADGRLVKFTVTVSDRPGGIAELTRLLANLGVSIKDMMHERAWIKNDIFSVEVKVIAETRDHEHALELRTALESQYKRLRFANPDHIHDDC